MDSTASEITPAPTERPVREEPEKIESSREEEQKKCLEEKDANEEKKEETTIDLEEKILRLQEERFRLREKIFRFREERLETTIDVEEIIRLQKERIRLGEEILRLQEKRILDLEFQNRKQEIATWYPNWVTKKIHFARRVVGCGLFAVGLQSEKEKKD